MTIASRKDIVTVAGNVANPKWVNSVPGHGIEDYFGDKESRQSIKSFLSGDKRSDSKELSVDEKTLIMLLKSVIERVYTDGIDNFVDIKTTPSGDIAGVFRDGLKFIDFTLKSGKLSYRLASRSRQDALGQEFLEQYLDERQRNDAVRIKRRQCVRGLACGSTCIARNKSCDQDLSKIAPQGDVLRLRQVATRIAARERVPANSPVAPASAPNAAPVITANRATAATPPDDLDGKTIRELKVIARESGVYRYSDMNSDQLRQVIRVARDETPGQQERIAQTVSRNRDRPLVARKIGLSTKSKPEKALNDAIVRWNRIQRITKLAGVDPLLVGSAIAAVTMGLTLQQYNKVRDRYRLNFTASADNALERGMKMQTEYIRTDNITFAVGGFAAEGSYGTKIRNLLEAPATKEDATPDDRWFVDKHKIITVDNKEFSIPPIKSSKYNPDGTYNPAYLAEASMKAFGAYTRNYRRGKNEAAIDLAARIWAYSNRRDPKTGEYRHRDKTINIIAHGTGGNTVYEAMEILSRMNAPRALPPREILAKINVVTLGTTDFGITDRGIVRERNITSAQDPYSFLPQRNEKWISTVKGHEVEDYLSNREVRDEVLQAFGRYKWTSYAREVEFAEQKRKRQKISPGSSDVF